MKPFKSDGCSMWPDGNYKSCCVAHDELYWRGGNWRDRLSADNRLFRCVALRSRFGVLMASLMWIGVRIGGHPLLPFPRWRWGYGYTWPKYKA